MARIEEIETFKVFCEGAGLTKYQDFDTNREAPDFVTWDGKMGIELVSYHRDAPMAGAGGSPRRSWEARLERFVADAKVRYLGLNGDRVDVCVFPQRQGRQGSRGVPPNALEEIVRLVAARSAGNIGEIPSSLGEILEDVMVSPTPSYQQESEWDVALADRVDVDVRAIQSILDVKERLVGEYRKRVNVVWLLIYGSPMPYIGGRPDAGRWSTCGHVTAALSATRFQSTFDRIYYFDQDQLKRVQLSVAGGLT